MATATSSIPQASHMGAVHLTVGDLDRSLYYGGQVGLGLIRREGGVRRSAPGTLKLSTSSRSRAPAGRYAGLFHFALRVPERANLARASGSPTLRAGASRWRGCRTTSSARRSTSPTPMGTGSRSTRPAARGLGGPGRYASGYQALDVGSLLQELDDPGQGALRRPSGGDGHGARASAARGRPRVRRLLPRRPRLRPHGRADGLGRIPRRGRLPPPTSARTSALCSAPPAPQERPGSCMRPSSFPTPMSATGSPRGSPAPDRSRKPARTACLSATRPGSTCSSPLLREAARAPGGRPRRRRGLLVWR